MTLRYFKNPYNDFSTNKENTYSFDKNFWNNYLEETLLRCLHAIKAKDTEKYCDGGFYVGSLGLIYAAYHALERGHCKAYASHLIKYMNNYLKSNEAYYSKDHSESRNVAFLLGKGGLSVAACFVAKANGDMNSIQICAKKNCDNYRICEPINFLSKGSDEFFVGRAGYLRYFILDIFLKRSQKNSKFR